MIPASERAKTVHALDRSATVTSDFNIRVVYFKLINFKSVIKVNTQHTIYFLRMIH
jgi:hypothetical protein